MEGGAKRTWKGFSAFPIIGTKEEGFECHSPVRLVVGDGSALPCGRCIPRCPEALHTEYWGAHGYSSWCRSELMALVEAQSSQSRGVHTIKTGPRLTVGLWLMLELELEAEEVCGYRNTLWSAQLDKEALAHGVSSRPFPSLLLLAAIHNKWILLPLGSYLNL